MKSCLSTREFVSLKSLCEKPRGVAAENDVKERAPKNRIQQMPSANKGETNLQEEDPKQNPDAWALNVVSPCKP